jgi:hypothetical protein
MNRSPHFDNSHEPDSHGTLCKPIGENLQQDTILTLTFQQLQLPYTRCLSQLVRFLCFLTTLFLPCFALVCKRQWFWILVWFPIGLTISHPIGQVHPLFVSIISGRPL